MLETGPSVAEVAAVKGQGACGQQGKLGPGGEGRWGQG